MSLNVTSKVCSTLTLILLISLFGCEETVVEPEPVNRYISEFVFFDESLPYVLKADYGQDQTFPEIFLWFEKNLGEPFTDVDGDGVYDPSIDSFYICDCDTNQDLNHDGQYNGPDDPWQPGIPFDDVDGDGAFRDSAYYFSGVNEGAPYFDVNGNGVWDDDLGYQVNFVRPVMVARTDSGEVWQMVHPDTSLYYLSDSGGYYYPSLQTTGCAVCSRTTPEGLLELTESGLFYDFESLTTLFTFELLSDSILVSDTTRVFLAPGVDIPSYRRIVIVGDSLQTADSTYTDLLKIRCEDLRLSEDMQSDYIGSFWEFYFSTASGLLAVHQKPFTNSVEQWYYFEPLDQPLPLLMTK